MKQLWVAVSKPFTERSEDVCRCCDYAVWNCKCRTPTGLARRQEAALKSLPVGYHVISFYDSTTNGVELRDMFSKTYDLGLSTIFRGQLSYRFLPSDDEGIALFAAIYCMIKENLPLMDPRSQLLESVILYEGMKNE